MKYNCLNTKWLVIAVLMMLCIKTGWADASLPTDTERMSAGIKLGLNIANLTGKGISNAETGGYSFSPKMGFCAGGFFNYSFGLIGIQPEVLFTQKGANFKKTILGTNYSGSTNLYLS